MLRTALWRGVEALSKPLREGAFVAGLAQYVWRNMHARRGTDTAPRVDSVRNVIGHVRRRHERRGMLFSDNKVVAHLLRGQAHRRLAEHGVALPVRAESNLHVMRTTESDAAVDEGSARCGLDKLGV